MGHGRLERMHDQPPGRYGAVFADVYDDWFAGVSDTEATVAGLSALGIQGHVLELGVGTGRIALPLAERGGSVLGLDASREMLDVLAAKPATGSPVVTVLADMVGLPFADSTVAMVFAAFNTFFNLTTEAAQHECMAEAARVLEPSGRFVVECFVPAPEGMPARGASVRDASDDSVTVTTSRHDELTQVINGEHVEVTPEGVVRRPWALRYASPDQLDAMAAVAGLVLESRTASFSGEDFDDASESHVSVYRLDPVNP